MSDRLTVDEIEEIGHRVYRWHEFGDAGDGGIHRIGWDRESLLTDRKQLTDRISALEGLLREMKADTFHVSVYWQRRIAALLEAS